MRIRQSNIRMIQIVSVLTLLSVVTPLRAETFDAWVKTIAIDPSVENSQSAFVFPQLTNETSSGAAMDVPSSTVPDSISLENAQIEVPEIYGSLLEADVRRSIMAALENTDTPLENDTALRQVTLNFDVTVAAEYYRGRWRSPVQIQYADTARFHGRRHRYHGSDLDYFYGPSIALGIDTSINDVKGLSLIHI